MTPNKTLLLLTALILLVGSLIAIYYLAKSELWSNATGVFWTGALTGFAGFLFLSSLILAISLRTTRSSLTRNRRYTFPMLIVLSGLVTAALLFVKPSDSDTWLYGAIAGFFSCLVLVFLTVTAYMAYKLKQ